MNKIIGIYKITSPSKKVYIGQRTGHKFSALNAKLSGQNKNDTQYVRV